MSKILIDEAVVRQALEALEVVARQPVGKGTVDAIAALRKALAEQPAPAHCEAGPEYCQQCCKESFEDRSLALAAAVRYVKNNTPNLVWTEIERALTAPQAQPAGYAKKIESLIAERDALKARLAEQPAPTNCRHCGGADNVICAGQCKEQPAQQQEPYGYLYEGIAEHTRGKAIFQFQRTPPEQLEKRWWQEVGPLYTTPPAQRTWVGLTDEERRACTQSPFTADNYLAIEAKLKERNT